MSEHYAALPVRVINRIIYDLRLLPMKDVEQVVQDLRRAKVLKVEVPAEKPTGLVRPPPEPAPRVPEEQQCPTAER